MQLIELVAVVSRMIRAYFSISVVVVWLCSGL